MQETKEEKMTTTRNVEEEIDWTNNVYVLRDNFPTMVVKDIGDGLVCGSTQ